MLKKTLLILSFLVLGLFFYFDGFYILKPSSSNTDNWTQNKPLDKPYKGIGAYIINLDRSIDRYYYIAPQVKALGFSTQRISGIDGSKLSDKEIEQKVDANAYKNYMGSYPKKGTIGCSLSHILAWETFLKSSFEYAIIFEDDVSFNPIILKKAIETLTYKAEHSSQPNSISSAWDITTFEILHRGLPLSIQTLESMDHKLCLYLTGVTHAGAYLINRKTATKLLSKAYPIRVPIDHFFNRSWELDIKFRGVEPRIVSQTYGDSEISKTTQMKNAQGKDRSLKTFLQRAIYIAKTSIATFSYNLKQYIEEQYLS